MIVYYRYDPEANVWTATSEDIPGLALEGEDLDGIEGTRSGSNTGADINKSVI